MIISNDRLLLSERDRQQELTLPIDVFFRSLAQDCGRRAVAIVLSGSGSDGSRGIRDVHDAGGMVMVQDLESAQFSGMPRTATETGVATPYELPNPEAALIQHRQDDEVLRTGTPQHYKLESRNRDHGEVCWDLSTPLPLLDKTRQIVGVIGIVRDVTTEKLAEEKIREAVRRRDEFLAMLSHELRNPLAAVVTATELIKDSSSEIKPALVEVLARQSQQLSRLLDDLLDASRVTQNKIELRKTHLDLRLVVEDAVAAARPMMASHDLAVSLLVDTKPLNIEGDASRLQQVCVNLLTNAAKYTPAGATSRWRPRPKERTRSSAFAMTASGSHPTCWTRSSICSCNPIARSSAHKAGSASG